MSDPSPTNKSLYCKICGSILENDSEFCGICGNRAVQSVLISEDEQPGLYSNEGKEHSRLWWFMAGVFTAIFIIVIINGFSVLLGGSGPNADDLIISSMLLRRNANEIEIDHEVMCKLSDLDKSKEITKKWFVIYHYKNDRNSMLADVFVFRNNLWSGYHTGYPFSGCPYYIFGLR